MVIHDSDGGPDQRRRGPGCLTHPRRAETPGLRVELPPAGGDRPSVSRGWGHHPDVGRALRPVPGPNVQHRHPVERSPVCRGCHGPRRSARNDRSRDLREFLPPGNATPAEAIPPVAVAADTLAGVGLLAASHLPVPRRWISVADGYMLPARLGSLRTVTPALVQTVHRLGRRVYAWTVDDPGLMRDLLGMGVDGLITNRPDLAVIARREFLLTGTGRSGPHHGTGGQSTAFPTAVASTLIPRSTSPPSLDFGALVRMSQLRAISPVAPRRRASC